MNKYELVKHIAEQNNCLQKDVENMLNIVLEGIRSAFETEEEIFIVSWGRFYKKKMKARVGRNPATGEEIQLPESMKVGLKAGKRLIEAANLALKPPTKKKKKKPAGKKG